jgi:signal transduction histidine kinase
VVAVAGDDADRGDAPLPLSDDEAVVRVDGERHVVRSAEVDADDGPEEHVVVARSLESADEATGAAALLLAPAVPAAALLVAAVTWVVVGRSLRPVERIRADVEQIGAGDPARRVDVPAGRDEVARLAETMNRMLDRLAQARAAQQRFVSDASHELRSPVAAIRQHAQVAQLHPGSTSLAALADVVEAEGSRLDDLVRDLLLLARVDEHGPGVRTEVDLDDVLLAEGARLRTLGVTVDATGVGPARVLADPALTARAVRNVVENARRHARSTVALGLHDDGATATLRVDDDGPGIPPEDRERVLRRFERREDARDRDSGGTGLGLAIVAEAARAGGGTVRIGEAPLGGARVEIRLPSAHA